jgi:hypothetical protein
MIFLGAEGDRLYKRGFASLIVSFSTGFEEDFHFINLILINDLSDVK